MFDRENFNPTSISAKISAYQGRREGERKPGSANMVRRGESMPEKSCAEEHFAQRKSSYYIFKSLWQIVVMFAQLS